MAARKQSKKSTSKSAIYQRRQRARKRGQNPDEVAPLPGRGARPRRSSSRRPARPPLREVAAASNDLLDIIVQVRTLLTGLTPEQRSAIRVLL